MSDLKRIRAGQLPRRTIIITIEVLAVVVLVVLNTVPILWGILTSIKPTRTILVFPPKIVSFGPTLEHYNRIIQSGFLQNLWVSVFNSAVSILLGVSLAILAAYGFDRFRFRSRKMLFFFVVLGIPLSIGSSMLLIPNFLYMSRLGLTDTRLTLVLLYTTYNLPMAIWIMKGAFEGVPVEIDEAARIEGASPMHVLWKLIVPLSAPALAAAALFIFIGSWNEFIAASVMVNAPQFRPVQLAVYNYLGYFGREWGPLTASATFALIPILVVFLGLGRLLISGLTAGSVKS